MPRQHTQTTNPSPQKAKPREPVAAGERDAVARLGEGESAVLNLLRGMEPWHPERHGAARDGHLISRMSHGPGKGPLPGLSWISDIFVAQDGSEPCRLKCTEGR